MVNSHATFPSWISPWKSSKISTDSFHRYCWSKNPGICLDKRHTWPNPTKTGSLRCYVPLMTNSMHKRLSYQWILSRVIDNQRILQSDWTRGTPGHTQPKVVVLDATFSLGISPCQKTKISLDSSRDIDDQRILQFDWKRGLTGRKLTKSSSPRSYIPLMTNSKQKSLDINRFFPDILIIKELCNLIEWKATLGEHTQK